MRQIPRFAVFLFLANCCCFCFSDETQDKIQELEKKLAAQKPGSFDWGLHNDLRHLYAGVDSKKSMTPAEAILLHKPMDGYMKGILSRWAADDNTAIAELSKAATANAEFPNLSAACWIWAGDLSEDPEAARKFYGRAWDVKGASVHYRNVLEDRLLFKIAERKPWPQKFAAPKAMKNLPGPWSDPVDPTVWPNSTSRANGDAWLAEHHDEIRSMKPRVLVINFTNEYNREHLDRLLNQLIFTLGESSRYHGYNDPKAPVFLNYQVFKFVELRDRAKNQGNSRKVPLKDPQAKSGWNVNYRQFFSPEFADYYAVPDPRDPKRNLRLDELLDGGYVHEVWFFLSDTAKEVPFVGAFEVVEEKPKYDAEFKRIGDHWVQAGNGGDDSQPWVGRSCRIAFINAGRGIGCFLESLSHGIEGTSNSQAIPYFTKYFHEYADFNLRQRYGVAFDSLYAVEYKGSPISYAGDHTAIVSHAGEKVTIENYTPAGGNAHFPPNARYHYDLKNAAPLLSTVEDWRIGSGPGGEDIAKPFTNQAFRGYSDIAPDCMGAWLVYWRQNFPGLDNKQKDDDGKPMKNWWPFLFY